MTKIEIMTDVREATPWDVARRAEMDFSKLPDGCPICSGLTRLIMKGLVACDDCDCFFQCATVPQDPR